MQTFADIADRLVCVECGRHTVTPRGRRQWACMTCGAHGGCERLFGGRLPPWTDWGTHPLAAKMAEPTERWPKLVWKMLGTGELIDGAVPFMPPSRAVLAEFLDGAWRECGFTPIKAGDARPVWPPGPWSPDVAAGDLTVKNAEYRPESGETVIHGKHTDHGTILVPLTETEKSVQRAVAQSWRSRR